MTTLNAREREQAAGFDDFYRARARSPFVSQLYAEAMGDAYPHEVAPYSSCDWPALGTMVGRLQLAQGQLLADVGCGTGGTGLWLARALNTQLIGIDVSTVAVNIATERRSTFVPGDHARFQIGGLETTGLDDACVHGLICIDAFSNAGDHLAALREFRRILAPGGRAIITRALSPTSRHRLTQQAHLAGLTVEHVDNRPHEPGMWRRLYQLWIHHEPQLRNELGNDEADRMMAEAQRQLPRLASRTAVIVTLSRPHSTAAA
ncbi:class I SAM-dependent methyltransferase [Streptomyces sp. CA-251387]|uniref:class I SAM-dependent methyltransferase n=1 Tax=Streptomyces sp. CA-251387 TaxID=3240064 RepID=UPI003D8A6C3C